MNLCAIVLAAGRSQRMGVQKLLLPWGDKTVISHIVDELLASPLSRVFVVVGRDEAAIQKALADRKVSFVPNPVADSEMLESIRCGLRALPADCDGALLVLGDQPGVNQELIAGLRNAFIDRASLIVAPVRNGKRGHPLLIGAPLFQEILTTNTATGLSGILQRHTGRIITFPTLTDLSDMDTPEDYERHRTAPNLQSPL